jgi:hypothetical protein
MRFCFITNRLSDRPHKLFLSAVFPFPYLKTPQRVDAQVEPKQLFGVGLFGELT